MIESEGMQMYLVNTDDFETVKGKYIDVIENTPDMTDFLYYEKKLAEI